MPSSSRARAASSRRPSTYSWGGSPKVARNARAAAAGEASSDAAIAANDGVSNSEASSAARTASARSPVAVRRRARPASPPSPSSCPIRSVTRWSRVSASSAPSGSRSASWTASTRRRNEQVVDERPVDGGPDQRFGQHRRLEVQHPHPVAAVDRRPAVVRDVRRERGHHRRRGQPLVPPEVVAHGAGVDDEQRPRVVRVARVRVRLEPRVEDLADARDGRPPGGDLGGGRRAGPCAESYKTAASSPGYGAGRGAPARPHRLRLRELGHAGPEQRAAVGVGRLVRVPAHAPARASGPRSGSRRWRSPRQPAWRD